MEKYITKKGDKVSRGSIGGYPFSLEYYSDDEDGNTFVKISVHKGSITLIEIFPSNAEELILSFLGWASNPGFLFENKIVVEND